ncbi:MAG: phospholipase D-like domain-containing protein [Gemmatimonadaceae bacterium]
MTFFKYGGWILLILILLVLMLVGILSVTRTHTVKHVIAQGDDGGPPHVRDPLFSKTVELYTGTHIDEGNWVDILLDGEGTYPLLWNDIASAKNTITVQMYFSQPGAVADTMAHYLSERARAGVRVLLLLDAFGSGALKTEWVERLEAAGVEVAWLRPLHWYTLHQATQRSHARVVVVDGETGYTGGFGLADYWLGDGHTDGQWRETNVRFGGPTVASLQAAFAAGWVEVTGELITGDMFFPWPALTERGDINAGLIHTMPGVGSTPAERFLSITLAGARKTLYIANAYFVPDDNLKRLLIAAVKRGVDVRVLTVGSKTDVKTTWYAGRAMYDELLEGGVRIYEYQPSMMHAKTMVVDSYWSTVGSMNFDNRSIAFNNETNIVVLNEGFGQRMDGIFFDDLKYSKEITLEEFRSRPLTDKLLSWGAERLWRLL